jgi:DNA adenine methylase
MADDLIYCDPPYLGRHVDYFDSWSEDDENRLFNALSKTKARFILSTWHSNQYRENFTIIVISRIKPTKLLSQ